MQQATVTGLILAGGASSRMGRNKALIAWEGKPLVARVAAALAPIADERLIVANDADPYRFLGLPVIPDIQPGYGPLMGLYSGLKAASGELAVVAAVDMPFLAPDFLRFLLALAPGYDVVIPEAGGRLHPLCAVYRRATCLPPITDAIARGQRRLIAFHPAMRVRRVPEASLRQVSPDLRALINVNTPEDLARARKLFRR
ncbi:MAG TPA: molybdenum cofactor guanylyltransferase [Anaerolineae bacterium]|nr:molybdenum cofactor guanylyltransferase [Anaerolineae bacterium]